MKEILCWHAWLYVWKRMLMLPILPGLAVHYILSSWLENKEYMQVVKKTWERSIMGTTSFRLMCKLVEVGKGGHQSMPPNQGIPEISYRFSPYNIIVKCGKSSDLKCSGNYWIFTCIWCIGSISVTIIIYWLILANFPWVPVAWNLDWKNFHWI